MKKRLLAVVLSCLGVSGCSNRSDVCGLPENAVLIDVRTREEFDSGHLKNAVLIPYDIIDQKITAVAPEKDTPLYLYCRSGRRVGMAMEVLQKMGYTDMHNLGGIEEARLVVEKCSTPESGGRL